MDFDKKTEFVYKKRIKYILSKIEITKKCK